MAKEELKDKYSAFIAEISEIMGLGKPIDILKLCATTDLFFRPLENRITDLEKENAELRAKESFVGDQNRKLCEQQQKIEVLEAENAELKRLKRECETSLCRAEYQYNYEQLTKAKELLKEFVHHYKNKTIYIENMQDLLEQVERFIKDSEV